MALTPTQLAAACDTVTNCINGTDGSTVDHTHVNVTPALATSLQALVKAAHQMLQKSGRTSVYQDGVKI